jgi:hypothetical protein
LRPKRSLDANILELKLNYLVSNVWIFLTRYILFIGEFVILFTKILSWYH